MKFKIIILLTIFGMTSCSRSVIFSMLMEKGKSEFKKEFKDQDYSDAVKYLEKAVYRKPNDAEAHYFLGYAYSRLNAKDGKGIIQMNLPLTLSTSKEFETVNKLTPKYTGEIVVLDPYSKLTAEWGSLGMKYWQNNDADSAIWAFNEGKKRGGFGDYFLSINRAVLDLCSQNSILISSGDNFTIPLWYLQIVEEYRTDVSVVDISLLNSKWYPRLLSEKSSIKFNVPNSVIDTISHSVWEDLSFTIPIATTDSAFTWVVKPNYQKKYFLRNGKIFLHILDENEFQRDVYFTILFNDDYKLNLNDYLLPFILVDKLNIKNEPPFNFKQYEIKITKILELAVQTVNKNSYQEIKFIDELRSGILKQISICLLNDNKEQAEKLLGIIREYASIKSFPYNSEKIRNYHNAIIKLIEHSL